jgi:hypothetical protein
MTSSDTDFDTWFDTLQSEVLDATGVRFTDRDSVKGDYDAGKDVFDVIDEIVDEYNA